MSKLWAKIGLPNQRGCREWSGYRRRNGYGQTRYRGETQPAHRAAFKDWWGIELPSWLCVLHNCPGGDNRACCNPDHLWVGTRGDNNRDREEKGRGCHEKCRGDNNGSRLHLERRAWGARNGARTHPDIRKGERNGRSKLTWARVEWIRQRYSQRDITLKQLGEIFRVHKSTIADVINNAIWKEPP